MARILATVVLMVLTMIAEKAACADFHAMGHWIWGFDASNVYGDRDQDKKDHFQATQRLRTQFGFRGDHGLDGQIQLEIGKTDWGNAAAGGALGTDANDAVKVRYAFLDWVAPVIGTKVRMGLQPVNMPSFVNGSPVFSEDSAAVTLSRKFSDSVDATLVWARASADNDAQGHKDEGFNTMDFFGLTVPFKSDGLDLTPYAMAAAIGIDSIGYRTHGNDTWRLHAYKSSLRTVAMNTTPLGGVTILANRELAHALNPWASVWWLGVGGQKRWDSLKIALEAAYGKADWGTCAINGRAFEMKREGWYGAGLVEYRLEYLTPGILGWYSSGDDGNPWNGSERMPSGKSANRNWKVLSLAYDGVPFCPPGGAQVLDANGTMIGSWGIVGRLAKISWLPKLEHLIRGGYIQGTNNVKMVSQNPFYSQTSPGGYLTEKDNAWEIDFLTTYKIYENLSIIFDADYLKVNWSSEAKEHATGNLTENFYRVGLTFHYHF